MGFYREGRIEHIETMDGTRIRVGEVKYIAGDAVRRGRAEMKGLCQKAGVEATKVFPRNLRYLFARTFYKARRTLAQLADEFVYSSIETTLIYLISTE
ncbi:MAG: hypothetical protein SOR61_03270 [Evtepia sp.]|uniref:hypothetical protein n=1 Tax=Evtepia sp. TaxID=2773933 RepID=UPI002A7588CF|nr:hypothetical protein [Evtepia sp.]MDY3014209.1 hypothetical protein [Evtepia sp.]